jgi:hypothetical protein
VEPQQQTAAAGSRAQHEPAQAAVSSQAHEQMLITDRDFKTAMRQHGLDWIADAIVVVQKRKPTPKPVRPPRPPQPTVRVPKKRGPKKGTKYKPRKKKLLALAAGPSSAQSIDPGTVAGGPAAPAPCEEVGQQGATQVDHLNDVDGLVWETENGGHEEHGLEFGGEADHVLHELINMYESQHGQLPTEDAIRSWMTTLQEATATSALASGVLGSDEVADGDIDSASAV